MKPVAKAIIYDSSCPMCQAYTKGFVKWGILADEHRIAFCDLEPEQAKRYMDVQRGRHEIPLVDLAGGPTLYGVETLSYLLSQRLPFIGTWLQCTPLFSIVKKLYSFISYNRRVITATNSVSTGIDSKPDFHLRYRVAFMVFAICISSLITWLLGSATALYTSALGGIQMLVICGSGWIIQGILATLFLKGTQRIEYLGQLSVLMLIGTLVLLPSLLIDALTHHSQIAWLCGSVLISSTLMHYEHLRRIRYIKISKLWLLTWSAALFSTAVFELWYFVNY